MNERMKWTTYKSIIEIKISELLIPYLTIIYHL